MPRYLSLFKYTPEGRKGFMKEKAAAREAALKLTIEIGQFQVANTAVSRLRNCLMLAPTPQLLQL
jgi:hypothetical protein